MREVLLEVMEYKGMGKTSLKVERLCALLDPRWKALGADQLVNGSAALRTRAEEDLKGVIAEVADASVGRGARGTCTQGEEVFETRETARGTCESGSWWWW